MLLLTSLVLVGERDAEARPRYRDKPFGIRLRLSASYGWIDYDSISRASNGRTTFVSAPHLGRRGELETWFSRVWRPWPVFGVGGQYELYPVRLFGQAISYSDTSFALLWRASGTQGASWNANEFVLGVGPSFQSFPDVRAYPRTKPPRYDMLQAGMFGIKFEARYRFKLNRSHRKWHADVRAHWTMPMSLYRTSTAELDRQSSRSFGATFFIDRNLSDNMDVGLGLLYQKNRLGYRPIESQHPQTIEWNNLAPMISIQVWY